MTKQSERKTILYLVCEGSDDGYISPCGGEHWVFSTKEKAEQKIKDTMHPNHYYIEEIELDDFCRKERWTI